MNNDVLSEDLKFNILKLLQMRDLSTDDKGFFVKSVMSEEGLSQRGFAKKYGLSYSTVNDWVSGRQMRKYYDEKARKDDFNAMVLRKELGFNGIDTLLDRVIFILSSKDFVVTAKTKRLIDELKKELDKVNI